MVYLWKYGSFAIAGCYEFNIHGRTGEGKQKMQKSHGGKIRGIRLSPLPGQTPDKG